MKRSPLQRKTPLRRKSTLPQESDSPLAIAHKNLWEAVSLMIRTRDNWTCFTCGTRINPNATDGRGKSMRYYMHAGHYKRQGSFKAVKYDGLNVAAQCENCNVEAEGNETAFALALERKYGFGILQEIERRSRLYFGYTIPVLEKLTQAAKIGWEEYKKVYDELRPKPQA